MDALSAPPTAPREPTMPAIARVACYMGGCVLASALWGASLFALFRPGLDILTTPARYPWPYNLYVVGSYLILMGGALLAWRRWEGEPLRGLGIAPRRMGRAVITGALWGLGSLGLLFALELALGWVSFDAQAASHIDASAVALAAVMALGFSFSEEFLFRGYVLRTLRRGHSAPWAVGLSALLFTTVHFLRFDVAFGTVVLPFTGLLLAGVLLGWLALETRTIWTSAGLHSAWVFLFLLADRSKAIVYPANFNLLTGGGYPIGGLTGIALVLALAAAMWGTRGGLTRPE
ncbi:MAG TPA: CPBP family intramembrane glutamic endopeptidase [Oscillatoriaceae cyanobacterium]